jgi:hypothetical protein
MYTEPSMLLTLFTKGAPSEKVSFNGLRHMKVRLINFTTENRVASAVNYLLKYMLYLPTGDPMPAWQRSILFSMDALNLPVLNFIKVQAENLRLQAEDECLWMF